MAANTSIVSKTSAILETTTSPYTTTLVDVPALMYGWVLSHTGLTTSGSADNNAVIVATDSGASTSTLGSTDGAFILSPATGSQFIPPGVTSITYQAVSGAPLLSITRSPAFLGNA